jgi:hypothetical protein
VSSEFEKVLETEFEKLDFTRFKVNQSFHKIFLCGGMVDALQSIPPSFRDRFVSYTATNDPSIHHSIVLAENFKDYFKENAYIDLLVFEDEIANLSTLVMIFLESPGSLVELGMFCSRPHFFKKLLIIAPADETEKQDSFIYLGPIEHISKKESGSVIIYPWPDKNDAKYDSVHLLDLLSSVKNKLDNYPKEVRFSVSNSGHVALLIFEIIRVSYPITVGEIDLVMVALGINISDSDIYRHIYLLSKFEMINICQYSSYKYYYPLVKEYKSINYGRDRNERVVESNALQLRILQSYITAKDDISRKRLTAKKMISKRLEGDYENI